MDLKALALDIAEIYKLNPKVEAALLGGSVSRNWHDEYSDIELFIFWKEAPTDHDRTEPIRKLNGEMIDFYPYEDEEWSETYLTEGIKLEISNFLTETINKVIEDVITKFDTDLNKQCIVATVDQGVSLSGDKVIENMKEKVKVYPDELSEAMIKENLHLGNKWNNREALLERQDWLMFYKVIVDVQTKIMGMLYGLNRQFVHHPAFKWQQHSLNTMTIKPTNIASRLNSVFLDVPKIALSELELIVQEVYELIKSEFPQVDLSGVIDRSIFLRPKNN
ncbi:DUF4037 domain-containing protein [Alkalibacillus silvisoli]|uniref:DUF4037 domain-containing protein n=1 Tax=Alkalibacillus silvisoli TaxID=392823 RepID=A0ABN0ZY29_9BACI